MSHRIVLAVVLLAVPFGLTGLAAQTPPDEGDATLGKGFFMAGWHTLDLESFNARLEANGFPAFSEGRGSLGGGGWATKNGFVIGGEGHGLLGPEETTSTGQFTTRLEEGSGSSTSGTAQSRPSAST